MIKLRQDDMIESVKSIDPNSPPVYFLTNTGITAVRTFFNFPSNIYDSEKHTTRRGYFTYRELRVSSRFIPHQYNLNVFAINAINILKKEGIKYSYMDERHIPDTYGIRPDAVLSTPNINMFLEMDMGSESISQLREKWSHYRTYVASKNFYESKKRTVVLFICNNKGRINDRMNLIKSSINEFFLDCCNESIDIYIGIPEKLLSVIDNIIIPKAKTATTPMLNSLITVLKKDGFGVALGASTAKYLNNVIYTFYIRSKTGNKEYLVQEFFGEPMSAMCKASFHTNTKSFFYRYFKRSIPMIIVGTSEDLIINNANVFELSDEDIFYTTLTRLSSMPFNEALFKVKQNGDIYCFSEDFKEIRPTQKLTKMPDLAKLRK